MSSGFLMSDLTMIDCVKRGTIAVICMTSPPCKMLDITDGPPDPATSAAPDNIALKSADEAPMKTGSNSIPYLSKMRASLATNQGRQLRPIGENGKGTFFSAWPQSREGVSSNSRIATANSKSRHLAGREDRKPHANFISDPPCVQYDYSSVIS